MRDLPLRLFDKQLKKSWPWLLYLDLILPGVLYLLTWLLPGETIAVLFARLYHSYTMYVSNPVPQAATLMGIVGLIVHALALGNALKRKDRIDFLITLVITVIVAVYYYSGYNYQLIRSLNFY